MKDWFKTREGALSENKWGRIIILAQVVVIMVLAFSVSNQRQAVVLVPPNLEDRATLEFNAAEQELQIAWGMYLTSLIGNVTPRSTEFLTQSIGRHLSPRMYRPVIEAIDAQAKQIREEQISLQFVPTVARYDEEIKKVIVSGELIIRGLRGAERREVRTYEMGFIVRNYAILLDSMRVIDGEWKREQAAEEEQ